MIVDGTVFPATGATTVTIQNQTLVLVSFTFPELTVTSLTPGEPLTFEQPGANLDMLRSIRDWC
jgi:hypothetical protein